MRRSVVIGGWCGEERLLEKVWDFGLCRWPEELKLCLALMKIASFVVDVATPNC